VIFLSCCFSFFFQVVDQREKSKGKGSDRIGLAKKKRKISGKRSTLFFFNQSGVRSIIKQKKEKKEKKNGLKRIEKGRECPKIQQPNNEKKIQNSWLITVTDRSMI